MSWTDELARAHYILSLDKNSIMLPKAHSTQNAQITVSINLDGTIPLSGFSQKVDKADAVTLIPVTEDSASRGAGINPHPFADKLIYIAKDYPKYVDGKNSDNSDYYNAYMEQLEKWCQSEFSTPEVLAVYTYLSNGTLISDLISSGILKVDPVSGKLTHDKIEGVEQTDCFVRFCVQGVNTWKDPEICLKYIEYNSSLSPNMQLCYATGKYASPTYKHPSKIRNTGDKAKLFSTNDESGFSYRGRFADKTQAVSISYDYSQNMHNALKCLISKQGINVDGLCILVWENNLEEVPDVTQRCFLDDDDDDFYVTSKAESPKGNTGEINKALTIKSLMGNKNKYKRDSKTILMMLDSATTGRLSMTEYAELPTSDYISNLEKWHKDTAWVSFGRESSFSVYEIASCAYGKEQGNNLSCDTRKEVFQRLLPCIAEGMKIPKDIVNALFIRACRPNSFEEKHWKRILNCACGMIRKRKIEKGGECSMALDKECHSRDYLYGRLLAVADVAEASTYNDEESRTTNAKRFFEAFSNHPYQTWDVIYKSLRPYLNRMSKSKSVYYERMINDITAMFEVDDFRNNSPLSPEFLHAYSCQVNELYTKKTGVIKEEE